MNYYETLAKQAESVEFEPSETSYFSESAGHLDSRLFRGATLIPNVRNAVLVLLKNHLELGYNEPMSWVQVFLAGSGVSFNWQAHRAPADLDCLVSVDYIQFRQSNQEYKGWSDREIAAEINQGFRNELHPRTDNFMNDFELTFYVNPNPNITELKPYAAYSVTNNTWVVPPTKLEPPSNPEWMTAVERDKVKAVELVKRYSTALDQIKNAANDAMRINAEAALAVSVQQGAAMFEDIHTSRSGAFSPTGAGYADFANYRWQAGKQSGVVPALRKIHAMSKEASERFSKETYGIELPDTSTLLSRTMRK
jgi:hypothetical protein